VDLCTAVRMCSQCPRLYIVVAVVMHTTVRGLSHRTQSCYHTQTRVTTIHFASSTTRAKCSDNVYGADEAMVRVHPVQRTAVLQCGTVCPQPCAKTWSLATFKTKLKTYLFRRSLSLLKTTRRCCGGFAISAP